MAQVPFHGTSTISWHKYHFVAHPGLMGDISKPIVFSDPSPETLFLGLSFTQLGEGEYVEFDRARNIAHADMLIGRVHAAAVIGRVA